MATWEEHGTEVILVVVLRLANVDGPALTVHNLRNGGSESALLQSAEEAAATQRTARPKDRSDSPTARHAAGAAAQTECRDAARRLGPRTRAVRVFQIENGVVLAQSRSGVGVLQSLARFLEEALNEFALAVLLLRAEGVIAREKLLINLLEDRGEGVLRFTALLRSDVRKFSVELAEECVLIESLRASAIATVTEAKSTVGAIAAESELALAAESAATVEEVVANLNEVTSGVQNLADALLAAISAAAKEVVEDLRAALELIANLVHETLALLLVALMALVGGEARHHLSVAGMKVARVLLVLIPTEIGQDLILIVADAHTNLIVDLSGIIDEAGKLIDRSEVVAEDVGLRSATPLRAESGRVTAKSRSGGIVVIEAAPAVARAEAITGPPVLSIDVEHDVDVDTATVALTSLVEKGVLTATIATTTIQIPTSEETTNRVVLADTSRSSAPLAEILGGDAATGMALEAAALEEARLLHVRGSRRRLWSLLRRSAGSGLEHIGTLDTAADVIAFARVAISNAGLVGTELRASRHAHALA